MPSRRLLDKDRTQAGSSYLFYRPAPGRVGCKLNNIIVENLNYFDMLPIELDERSNTSIFVLVSEKWHLSSDLAAVSLKSCFVLLNKLVITLLSICHGYICAYIIIQGTNIFGIYKKRLKCAQLPDNSFLVRSDSLCSQTRFNMLSSFFRGIIISWLAG